MTDYRAREKAILAELSDGEQLLWAGGPTPMPYAAKSWPAALFGAFFTGIVFTALLHRDGAPMDGSRLILLAFLAVGLLLTATPVFHYWTARNLIYGITNQGALILGRFPSRSLWRCNVAQMTDITVQDRGAIGDIFFAETPIRRRNRKSSRDAVMTMKKVGFVSVKNPRHVESLLRSALQSER